MLGFLTEYDMILVNPDHELVTAKQEVLELANDNWHPELGKNIFVGARSTASS